MFVLNSRTKTAIQQTTGLDPAIVPMMDHEEIDDAIEEKIGKKLEIGLIDSEGLAARGNVYIHLNRLISNLWIEKELSKI